MLQNRLKKLKVSICLFLCLVIFPISASANIVWPTLYIASGLRSWYIIFSGLVIEFLLIHFVFKENYQRSGLISLIMNLVSTVVGIVLLPFVGFFGAIGLELLFEAVSYSGGTFDIWQWALGYILCVFANALVEGLTVKMFFKMKFKKTFWWLVLANALSVIICIIALGFTPTY